MSGAKLILTIILVIVFGQLQCVAACAGIDLRANEPAPPCHKHHQPSSPAQSSCADHVESPATPPVNARVVAPEAPVVATAAPLSFPASNVAFAAADSLTFSPPGSCLSSVVLRV